MLGYNQHMTIPLDEVRHVARLARLELDEGELLLFQSELNSLLDHFGDLEDFDLADDPMPYNLDIANVVREDVVADAMLRQAVLKNAPRSRAGLFIVPKLIEE